MKKGILTFLLILSAVSACSWFVLKSLERERQILASTPGEQVKKRAEDSPYPAELWHELGRLGESIRISQHAEDDLPRDIDWENGTGTPILGDSRAVKGGVLRQCGSGPFPANFLAFGRPSPQYFHYNLFEIIEMPLVQRHPETHAPLPALAEAWAVRDATVWFRLHPKARYNNGKRVRAGDFALGILLRAHCQHGAEHEHLVQTASAVSFYGDSVIAVTLRKPCPMALFLASSLLHAAEPGFYAEFGSDYTERYAQRIPPTTGAYAVERVEHGRLIRLKRTPDWWAADLPHRRYTCNVDAIEYHYLRDEAQAWELLLRGELNILQTRDINAWQQRQTEEAAFRDGRICPHSFTVEYPFPPYGIALNTGKLSDITLRRGILHAMDMQKAIEVIFRGEGEQLQSFTGGYGRLSPRCTPTYEYSPAKARRYFSDAGFTERGNDGILRRPDGTRLSFKLTYTPSAKADTLVTLLAQSAKDCGLELLPDAEPWQNIDRMNREGGTELLFWAAAPSALMPQPGKFLHSAATGADAPFHLKSPEMDDALQRCAEATSFSAMAAACAEVDELVYQLAIWLPGWKENRVRLAAWHYVHLPEHYSGPYDVAEGQTLWMTKEENPSAGSSSDTR